jgi:hypothetical protein
MIRWPAAGDALLHGEIWKTEATARKAVRHVAPV